MQDSGFGFKVQGVGFLVLGSRFKGKAFQCQRKINCGWWIMDRIHKDQAFRVLGSDFKGERP